MQQSRADWRTIILAFGAVGCTVLAFSMAALMVVGSVPGTFQAQLAPSRKSLLDILVLASAVITIGIAFVPAAYYAIRRLRGQAVSAARPGVMRIWQGALLVLIWLGAAAGAQLLASQPVGKWLTPILYVLAIVVPVLFFARLATGGLDLGPRTRPWGTLAAGIVLGITPAIVAELLLGVLALIGVGIYVAMHPEQLSTFQNLLRQLQNASDTEQMINLVSPWLTSPIVLLGALVFFAALSPIIEETAKSLTAWTLFDRLTSPAQGFAIGAISGAAFGLVESLLVSASPGPGWMTTLLVRGASTMMHIMSASLTGWGIASLRTRKSLARLVGTYLAAIGLHGVWNASVVAVTFGSIRSTGPIGTGDPIGMVLIYSGVAILLSLCLAIPVAMGLINWMLRKAATADLSISPELAAAVPTGNREPREPGAPGDAADPLTPR